MVGRRRYYSTIWQILSSRPYGRTPIGERRRGTAALREVYPHTEEQTCWFHNVDDVLDKIPRSVHRKTNTMIREMCGQARSLQEATARGLRAVSVKLGRRSIRKAVECLRE